MPELLSLLKHGKVAKVDATEYVSQVRQAGLTNAHLASVTSVNAKVNALHFGKHRKENPELPIADLIERGRVLKHNCPMPSWYAAWGLIVPPEEGFGLSDAEDMPLRSSASSRLEDVAAQPSAVDSRYGSLLFGPLKRALAWRQWKRQRAAAVDQLRALGESCELHAIPPRHPSSFSCLDPPSLASLAILQTA